MTHDLFNLSALRDRDGAKQRCKALYKRNLASAIKSAEGIRQKRIGDRQSPAEVAASRDRMFAIKNLVSLYERIEFSAQRIAELETVLLEADERLERRLRMLEARMDGRDQ